ncbi:MAG: peptidylprolyl isomerase [Bacteroidia bacterium]|nr:peptidylprolyl isomerase [Bacteroidia bacterium]MCZ2247709.1 peptidylprolyl isomerase [Bacteroidia bacterium]
MKLKKINFILVAWLGISVSASAQNSSDPVIMNIAGKDITKSEFESIYHKNNSKASTTDSKQLDDYVQLFINFKLKVKEAEDKGLDTAAAFRNELEGYRKQLAAPYLTDNEVNDWLLKEAYDRMKKDVRASHILIKCEPDALPKDTLAAYNKAIAARNRILKGENFAKVAQELSDDPSAKDNGGDLGYFTSMMMVYPFETATYKAELNKITMPIRTRFGYHLILKTDERPNQGQITVAHIMVKAAQKDIHKKDTATVDPKVKIDEIYAKLKGGADFAELAKQQSDDKGSAKKGGELPTFSTGRMVAEFENAAFALKNDGDISEPIKTQYGWHIIKRLNKKELGSFEELKPELKAKINKDSRSATGRESKIAKIKKEYNFKENLKLRDEFVKVMDTTYFEGQWKQTSAAKLNKPALFNIGDKTYNQQDFATYLESHQTHRQKIDFSALIREMYKNFVDETCLAYEESRLPSKYPEYKALLQEYRDGILLFDLTNSNVWSKAVTDTTGLKEFYEANKTKYMWPERAEATIYMCANEKVAQKTRKMVKDKAKKKYSNSDILATINKDSQLNLNIENGKFSKGENEIIDKFEWKKGLTSDIKSNNQTVFVDYENILPPTPKTITEAKGIITADYQNELEKQWIAKLRGKYKVTINKDVLSTVK